MWGTCITGNAFQSGFADLEYLVIRASLVDDDGLHSIVQLPAIRHATIADMHVTEFGVIKAMGALDQPPEVLGHLIGAALVGTFAGILFSYGNRFVQNLRQAAMTKAPKKFFGDYRTGEKMKAQRVRRVALISAVAGVLVAGLISAPSSQAAGQIKIGYINATIGPFAGPAPEITKGFKLALKEIKGQVNGKKIVVIEEASDATAATALEKAKKLVEKDKVDIVFGPLSGDEGVAIANYAKKTPAVTFVNTASSATETTLQVKAPNFFRFHGDAAQWSGGVGPIAYNQGYKRVAIVADDYSFPYANAGGFATGFCKAGGTIVAAQWPALGTKDYSSVIAALPKDIDAVYAGLGGADAVQFLKQAVEFGLKKPLIGGAILVDGSVLNSKADLGDAALNTIGGGPVPDSSKMEKSLKKVANVKLIFDIKNEMYLGVLEDIPEPLFIKE